MKNLLNSKILTTIATMLQLIYIFEVLLYHKLMNSIIYKPDSIGSIASILCLIHCVATPFIFITQACTMSCCAGAPIWWQSIDYIFIIISFFAILRSTQTSSNQMIKIALWIMWVLFCISIINTTLELFYINQNFKYATGIILASLHIYNLKYCQCDNEQCCVNHD